MHLNHDDAFSNQERTRGAGADSTIQIRARFLLTDEDKELIADIPEAAESRQLVVWKKDTFNRGYRLDPQPKRDRTQRRDVRDRLQRLRDSGWPPEVDGEDDQETPLTADLVDDALASLSDDAESLSVDDEIATLTSLLDRLDRVGVPHVSRGLPERLRQLIEYERETHPHDLALGRLIGRVPRFLKFGDEHRNLRATYELGTDDDPAVRNLLNLAGTTYEEALEVAEVTEAERLLARQDAREASRAIQPRVESERTHCSLRS